MGLPVEQAKIRKDRETMFEPSAEARRLSKSLWIVLLVASLVFVWLNSGAERALSQSCEDPGYATDHILVRMEDEASEEALDRMKNLNGEGGEAEFYPNTWRVDLPAGYSVFQAVGLYGSDQDVEYAEVDQLAQPDQAGQNCPEVGARFQTSFTDTPDPVAVGEKLAYEITVRNHGPGPAGNASVTTHVPEGAALVSSGFVNGAEKGGCPPGEDGIIKCRFGELGVGESARGRRRCDSRPRRREGQRHCLWRTWEGHHTRRSRRSRKRLNLHSHYKRHRPCVPNARLDDEKGDDPETRRARRDEVSRWQTRETGRKGMRIVEAESVEKGGLI